MNFHNILHKLVVGIVMLIGFGIALSWPQYKKHQTITQAQHALDFGREIAYQESVYKAQTGRYEPDFSKLDLSKNCASVIKDGVDENSSRYEINCPPYVFYLKGGHIVRVDHPGMPEWFELDIDAGTVTCSHEENSWAGEHICDRMDVSSLKF